MSLEKGHGEPLEVECPQCDAPPGLLCQTASGKTRTREHEPRRIDGLHVSCSHCGADPGKPCETSGGRTKQDVHRSRAALAYREMVVS